MNRKKYNNEVHTTNYDLSPFMPHNLLTSTRYDNETLESLREKLEIKSEALNLLSKQLELCNKEKNDYKRLIDTLYDKNLSLKKTIYFNQNRLDDNDNSLLKLENNKSNKSLNKTNNKLESISSTSFFNDIDSEDYVKVLKDLIKTLQKEKQDLIQKNEEIQQELSDSRSDLRLLREQIVRQRVGSYIEGLTTSVQLEDLNRPAHLNQSFSTSSISTISNNLNLKESYIKEIEVLREQKNTIENDLKLAICQKEELEIERDSYKEKYLKLNKFLIDSSDDNNNKKNTKLSLNIDELMSQNKYLTDVNKNLKEELEIFKSNLKKVKNKEKVDFGLDIGENSSLNKQKIKSLLNKAEEYLISSSSSSGSSGSDNDLVKELKQVLESLIDNLNDKIVAIQHQKKVNKMLASRIEDLEKQLNNLNNLNNLKYHTNNTSPFSCSSLSPLRLPEPMKPNQSNDSSLIKFESDENN